MATRRVCPVERRHSANALNLDEIEKASRGLRRGAVPPRDSQGALPGALDAFPRGCTATEGISATARTQPTGKTDRQGRTTRDGQVDALPTPPAGSSKPSWSCTRHPSRSQDRRLSGTPRTRRLQVSHATIYLYLYVQGRGALRQELPRAPSIRQDPAPAEGLPGDRAGAHPRRGAHLRTPPRGEGSGCTRALEGRSRHGKPQNVHWHPGGRSTRYLLLMKLEKNTAKTIRTAIAEKIRLPPCQLKRSITWSRAHGDRKNVSEFTIATGVQIYFCDPQEPVAAGDRREHQRPGAPVLPQGHRPVRALPGHSTPWPSSSTGALDKPSAG